MAKVVVPEKKTIRVAVGDVEPVKVSSRDFSWNFSFPYEIRNRERIDVESSLEFLIERLNELESKYKESYGNLTFDGIRDCSCYRSDCGCSPTYYLHGNRLETDLEFNYRVEQEQKREEESLKREQAEFERLKKKFK